MVVDPRVSEELLSLYRTGNRIAAGLDEIRRNSVQPPGGTRQG